MDEAKQTFTCSCKTPWTGEKCEIKIGKKKASTANRNELACTDAYFAIPFHSTSLRPGSKAFTSENNLLLEYISKGNETRFSTQLGFNVLNILK